METVYVHVVFQQDREVDGREAPLILRGVFASRSGAEEYVSEHEDPEVFDLTIEEELLQP